jgi:putative transposase
VRTQFNAIKDELCPWVREVRCSITEAAFESLGAAFNNFFRGLKTGQNVGYPKFKSRYQKRSFRMKEVKVETDRIHVSKLGWVRLSQSDYIPVGAKYGVYPTFSERAGHWYVSVLVKDETEVKADLSNNIIGIDFGIKDLAILSTGKVFENSRYLYEAERKLKRLQKELSRRTKGGANYTKTKQQLARVHASVADARSHTLHQISNYVTAKCHPAMIVIEDLNVSGMVKNHHLAKAISDVSFSELRQQIEYKAQRLGIEVVIADRWFPSSKTCSRCGEIKSGLTLADRTFVCDGCGYTIDRDLNAAINLAAYGQNRQTGGDCLGS